MKTEDTATTRGSETTGPPGHEDTKMNVPQSHEVTEIDSLTRRIIGSAIEVHRVLGPGLLEIDLRGGDLYRVRRHRLAIQTTDKIARLVQGSTAGRIPRGLGR